MRFQRNNWANYLQIKQSSIDKWVLYAKSVFLTMIIAAGESALGFIHMLYNTNFTSLIPWAWEDIKFRGDRKQNKRRNTIGRENTSTSILLNSKELYHSTKKRQHSFHILKAFSSDPITHFHLSVLESVYIKTQNPVFCRQKEFTFSLGLVK